MKNLDTRFLVEGTECRANEVDGKFFIEGYALKFDTRSNLLGGSFYETLERGCLDNCDMSNVLVRINHMGDMNSVVGRSGVNLVLSVDAVGLRYVVELDSESERDMQLYRDIKRGLLPSSSFAFTIAEDGDELSRTEDGTILRKVKNIDKLYDVAPVHNPAYDDTSVSARCSDSIMEFEKEEAERSKENEEESKRVKHALNFDDEARLRLLKQKM